MNNFNPQDFTILMVDDVPKNIQVLGNILGAQNYAVEYALNGQDALESMTRYDYDLILLDVMMPGIDGFQVCKTIRQNNKYKDVPIIFLTAKTDQESIVNGFQMGAQDYVTKPFDSSELLARVKTHLELKMSKQRLKETNKWLEEKVSERTKDLHESNNKLHKANKELEVLDVAKNNFLNIISHEIRTPLNGILGFVSLLKEEVKDEKVQEMVDALDLSCKRLEGFSLNALDISSIYTSGEKVLSKEKISINDSMKKAIDDIRAKNIIHQDITVSLESCLLSFDIQYFYKCFQIIIENAILHSPDNGKVIIRGEKQNSQYKITVKDEGAGFNETLINNGIKPFASSEHIDHNPGLDLYLCKLIIEAHKGTLSLNNDNGGVVEISIPLN